MLHCFAKKPRQCTLRTDDKDSASPLVWVYPVVLIPIQFALGADCALARCTVCI